MSTSRPLLALVLVAGAWAVADSSWADPLRRPPENSTADSGEILNTKLPVASYCGSLSCASASCHAAGDHGRPGSEYSTWVNGDPHLRSYAVLFEKKSRDMIDKLGGRHGNRPSPAHKNENCLRCHAPQLTSGRAMSTRPQALMGVGCEDCHGPAEKYLTEHYRADFKGHSRAEKVEQYGLFPTKNLSFRITMCASCHVGDADREVNHDLIAAGHPRLAFEYTSYHHWKQNVTEWRHWEETAYGPDFEARAWQIGQVASARVAAKLLQVRAERAADSKTPWPELSEYSCYACHRDLSPTKSWKQVTDTVRAPGAMPWGTWYFSTVETTCDPSDRLPDDLARLIELMAMPRGRSDEIARRANRLVEHLSIRLGELQRSADLDSPRHGYDGKQLTERFAATVRHALTPDGSRFRDLDWDGVTQHYLGLAAYYYAWAAVDPSGRDSRFRPALAELGGWLSFPRRSNSPKDTDPTKILNSFRRLRIDTLEPPVSR